MEDTRSARAIDSPFAKRAAPRVRTLVRLRAAATTTAKTSRFISDDAQGRRTVERRLARPGERPTFARTQRRKQFLGIKTTLSQAWSGNCIRGPQCAFEMSMFMCPAVHKLTRN